MTGIAFLFLVKYKNLLQGYATPRTFSILESDRAVRYDIGVVDKWLLYLRKYAGEHFSIDGKEILELGPGADLGVGLYLLSMEAFRYHAIDVNNLIAVTPQSLYDSFFKHLQNQKPDVDINDLRQQLTNYQKGEKSRLNYVYNDDFNILSAADENSIDVIFSQAAFEHFENVEKTIQQVSMVAKPGAKLVCEIDLKTHSRWIRAKDPNNIYRYSDWFYNLFDFRGIPNRMRPSDYKIILQNHGWTDIMIFPIQTLSNAEIQSTNLFLNARFQHEDNQMYILACVLCATKSK